MTLLRVLLFVSVALLLGAALPKAAVAQVPGVQIYTNGKQTSSTNGQPVNCVTGCRGGASTTTTAVATPPATGAGTGKPLNTDLFGGLWIAPEFGGQLVDATHGLPENLVQIGGVNILAGAGAVGTGAARVAVGQDTTTIAGSAPGTAGTPSANVVSMQGVAGGTPAPVSGTVTATTNPGARTIVTLDVKTVTTGGTAVNALSAGHRTAGGWLQNPAGATIALCINEIGTATGTTSSGDTTCIQPGQSYTLTAAAGAVSVVTSDSSHPFSGMGWQ